MSAADTLIVRDGPVAVPMDYQQPAGSEIEPMCVTASFDGSGAAGSFLPILEVIAPDGHVVARCPTDSSVAAGASADVSWFPGVTAAAQQSSAGSGPAVLFDQTLTGVANAFDTGPGLAQTHTDLLIVTSLRTNEAITQNGQGALKFNLDNTAAHYKTLTGPRAISTAVSAATTTASTGLNVLMCAGTAADANTFGTSFVYIADYTATKNKVAVALQGVLSNFAATTNWNMTVLCAVWNGNAAITEIVATPNIGGGGQFVAGCRLTVYGLG